MHKLFAKVARHAFGKGAAFCYAVAVAVSGQLAYNYLKPRDPAPKPVAVAAPASHAATPLGTAAVAPIPQAMPPEPEAPPTSRAGEPTTIARPISAPRGTTGPSLPDPPSTTLPIPVLKAAVLPPGSSATSSTAKPSAAAIGAAREPFATANGAPPDAASHSGTAALPSPTEASNTPVSAPIPLLPSDGAAEVEKAAIPARPGPGSGGLY
ncbi:MAG: hypothetical protein AB7H71_09760 [Alphaproteobacteria bacterium]